MNILTPKQKTWNDARSKAGALLKHLGLTGRQRQQWLDRHVHLAPGELIDAIRREFGKGSRD
jgi:hypothetical protein